TDRRLLRAPRSRPRSRRHVVHARRRRRSPPGEGLQRARSLPRARGGDGAGALRRAGRASRSRGPLPAADPARVHRPLSRSPHAVSFTHTAPLAAGVCALAATTVAVLAVRGLTHTDGSPIAPGGIREDLWTGGVIGAFVLYAAGSALLRRGAAPLAAVAAVAAAIQLVPLAAPLLLSRDVYL